MPEDFPDMCVECLLKQPFHHAEPWTCPACGLIHAVVMPGVPLAKGPEKRPKWMTPEREEAIECALVLSEWWRMGTSCDAPVDDDRIYDAACEACDAVWEGSGPRAALPDAYLEAASLLRDGWNPGDPVVRL